MTRAELAQYSRGVRGWHRFVLSLALFGAVCLPATRSAAQGPGDGVYGRLAGELALSAGAGGGVTIDGRARPTFVGELRLRFVDSAGPFVSARWGPDAGEQVVVGAEIRPLFPMLFLQNLSTGYEWADLVVQSFGVELGAALSPLDDDIGVGLAVGLGLELPLVLPSQWADGLWLRLGARYVDGSPADQLGPPGDIDEWTAYATLAFKGIFGNAVSTWAPPRYRLP